MFRSLFGKLSSDLAIDLGTANTLVYAKGKGIITDEPSVVAVQKGSITAPRKMVAFGKEAKGMAGRTPHGVETVRPLKDGVISDFEVTGEMLRYFINQAMQRRGFARPRVVICVPYGITAVEKRAVKDSAEAAGAGEVLLVEEPMAAAIGAGLPVTEARGSMIVDIGGGTTEVAVISLKGIVYSQSLRVGGDKMDEAIVNFIRKNYNLAVGVSTAEEIKLKLGSAFPSEDGESIEIRGRDLIEGLPRVVTISEIEVAEALSDCIRQICEVIRQALENTPPELASDVFEHGITLTGGGALLRNLDKLLREETGLPVLIADEPLQSVVKGSGTILDKFDELKEVTIA